MAEPITPLQMRALQTMWSAKMRRAGIAAGDDSAEMRHDYISAVTKGRARSARELSRADAITVIRALSREALQIAGQHGAHAAGTHGRYGNDDGREAMLAGPQQFALLRHLQAALGWDQVRLDAFVARQLGPGKQIHTMADINRVVWPMKRMARAGRL